MDGIKIFHLNDNKYYVFLEKYKNIIEANIRKNFFTIKNIEEALLFKIKKMKIMKIMKTMKTI